MSIPIYEALAKAKGVSITAATKLVAAARKDIVHPITRQEHWQCLANSLETPNLIYHAVEQVGRLQRLHTMLSSRGVGTCRMEEDGDFETMTLHYTHNGTGTTVLPMTDFTDFTMTYNAMTNVYSCSGTVFGTTVRPVMEPSMFLLETYTEKKSSSASVRDFLERALKISERYGGQNLENFLYKLMVEIPELGLFEHCRPDTGNYAMFTAGEVDFKCWFAHTKNGISIIKFAPAISTSGFPVSPKTFRVLGVQAIEHVKAHKEFVDLCVAALRHV